MRAVVTGGAGFIGSNLVDRLIDRSIDVHIIDNLVTGRKINLTSALANGATLHNADITDDHRMAELMEDIKPEVVFHLAAQIDVRRAVSDPAFDARVNIGGTATVLEAARRAGTRRFLLASTGGALYGEADQIPTSEDAPIRPMAPYGVSKAAAETYCSLFARLHGMSTACLRLANVYGARQDPLGEAGVVAIFCGIASQSGGSSEQSHTTESSNEAIAPVYGDGKQTRDYVYVGDVVDAFVAASESDYLGSVNIGTSKETSVLDLVNILKLEPEFRPSRAGEVSRSCLATDRAQQVIGWKAKVGLEDGLGQTLQAAEEDLSNVGV